MIDIMFGVALAFLAGVVVMACFTMYDLWRN